jgi:hypothetical protein
VIGLFVIVAHALYLWLAVSVTLFAARRARTRFGSKGATTAIVVSVLVFLLIPIWDELLGIYQFRRLCEQESGVKIYGRLELPKSFYSETGTPLFVHANGDIDGWANKKRPGEQTDLYRYVKFERRDETVPAFVEMKKSNSCMMSSATGKWLMCRTRFVNLGGWWRSVSYISLFHGTGRGCGETIDYRKVHNSVFFSAR